MAKMLADENTIGTIPVHRFLKETGCPECYLDNAEYLEKFDPHGLYPTSIYRRCEGDILAKADASVVECTMRHTLTTTAKIVYKVLDPANQELKNVYQPIGRFVTSIRLTPFYNLLSFSLLRDLQNQTSLGNTLFFIRMLFFRPRLNILICQF